MYVSQRAIQLFPGCCYSINFAFILCPATAGVDIYDIYFMQPLQDAESINSSQVDYPGELLHASWLALRFSNHKVVLYVCKLRHDKLKLMKEQKKWTVDSLHFLTEINCFLSFYKKKHFNKFWLLSSKELLAKGRVFGFWTELKHDFQLCETLMSNITNTIQ